MPDYAVSCGDCLDVMRGFADETFHSVVTDPPYGIRILGKEWDHGVPGDAFWAEALRVAKPGAHLLAFGGTRTFHRLACAIEDAGWELTDCLMWLYAQGFPKSHDVGKALDKDAGAERQVVGRYQPPGMKKPWNLQKAVDGKTPYLASSRNNLDVTAPATDDAKRWDGFGTALKPAWEPIVLARKPLDGRVIDNVRAHGCGALNVDGCRIGFKSEANRASAFPGGRLTSHGKGLLAGPGSAQAAQRSGFVSEQNAKGRWPANLSLSHDERCVRLDDGCFACVPSCPVRMLDSQSGDRKAGGSVSTARQGFAGDSYMGGGTGTGEFESYADDGGASRFFFCPKTTKKERDAGVPGGNHHVTVKPIGLMRWLVRLVTPPGGTVLDPFMGSGSTGCAAALEGVGFEGIDVDEACCDVAQARIDHWLTSR